jgi:signal peptidase
MLKTTENIYEKYLLPLHVETLKEGQSVKTRVGGISMYPFLKKGDIIIIHPIPLAEIKRGDIVVFQSSGKIVAHRLIIKKKDQSGYLTRGDTCPSIDPPVTRDNYLGKVMEVTRNGKNILPGITRKVYSTIMVHGYWLIMLMMRILFSLNKVRHYLFTREER